MAGRGVCCGIRVRIGSSPSLCIVPLALFPLHCVLWVGKCGGVRGRRGVPVMKGGGCGLCPVLSWVVLCPVLCCVVPLCSPPCLCVRCHSIVGLVWCFCGGVVLLWNGGGVWGCVVLVVLSCLSSVLFLFFLAFGVRGSARAALRARTLSPNTIVFLLLSSLLSSSFFSFFSPFFYVGMAVEGSPCVTVFGGHDSNW